VLKGYKGVLMSKVDMGEIDKLSRGKVRVNFFAHIPVVEKKDGVAQSSDGLVAADGDMASIQAGNMFEVAGSIVVPRATTNAEMLEEVSRKFDKMCTKFNREYGVRYRLFGATIDS
jgi:hypothetical protein